MLHDHGSIFAFTMFRVRHTDTNNYEDQHFWTASLYGNQYNRKA